MLQITITPEEAKAKILAAHAEGRLAAQMPPGERSADYYAKDRQGRVYRCAVGALFSEEQALEIARMQNYPYAHELVSRGYIFGLDGAKLQGVQLQHDRWLGGRSTEAQFLEAVNALA